MAAIIISPELWASRMLPEGILDQWIVSNGTYVNENDPVATVSIEDATHYIEAPAAGRLFIECQINNLIEPGQIIGRIES